MKKILVVGIVLLFLGSSIPALAQTKESIRPFSHTLYVGGSGPGNYTTIQKAIDDSSDGDTVFIFNDSSPYCENLIIRTGHAITLQGEDRDSTVVYGVINNTQDIIVIKESYVTVKNLTVNTKGRICLLNRLGNNIVISNVRIRSVSGNSRSNEGIYILGSHCTIQDCMISDTSVGIDLANGSLHYTFSIGNSIINNRISNCSIGISTWTCFNFILSNNTITNCSDNGIDNYQSIRIKIIHNNISLCGCGIYTEGFLNMIIKYNKIQSCNEGIYFALASFNKVSRNDFISNQKDASFTLSYFSFWWHNFWGRPLIRPKIILGINLILVWGWFKWPDELHEFDIPWINLDLFPSLRRNY